MRQNPHPVAVRAGTGQTWGRVEGGRYVPNRGGENTARGSGPPPGKQREDSAAEFRGQTTDRRRDEPVVRKVTCYRCSRDGYISINCPNIECYKCRCRGHMALQCPVKRELNVLNCSKRAIGGFKLPIRIDDKHNVKGLLDTGAEVCVMRESCARNMGLTTVKL